MIWLSDVNSWQIQIWNKSLVTHSEIAAICFPWVCLKKQKQKKNTNDTNMYLFNNVNNKSKWV